jgi:catechol 2,3-dioxygenase-like lactoylglutathione lyase family enzyme
MTAITHVGVGVPDLERAEAWYRDALGLEQLGPRVEVRTGEGHAGTVAADVLGSRVGSFRQAHLTAANGVAVELFEFDTAPDELRGVFHFCAVVRDVAATARHIAATGGRRTSRVWQIFEGEPFLACYCRDPFGNIVELYSHSHERTYSNRGAPS